jgi:nucleoside-diphosphate-sugar epimerase
MPCRPLPPEDLDHVIEHTLPLWEEARGRTFFITGGTGFFGMWLLESFAHINDRLGLGMRATVLTRSPEAFAVKAPHLAARPDLTFIRGDVRDFALPGGPFDYIIHAATEASAKLNEEAPDEMFDAIIGGTRRVLELTARCGVKKLLLTSSGAVYGKQPSDMTHVPETYTGAPDPLLPGSAYGVGKRASEHMCVVHAKRHGYETKIARCFAFVGPHLPLDAHFAIGNFIRDAMRGEPIRIGGDGTPMRSYLYASDLVVWLWTILFKAPSSHAFNVGSDVEISIARLAEQVRAAIAPTLAIQIASTPGKAFAISRYVPSTISASSQLQLNVLIPLTAGIKKTSAWYARSVNDTQNP